MASFGLWVGEVGHELKPLPLFQTQKGGAMTIDQWIVTGIGIALAPLVFWFLWLRRAKRNATMANGGRQEALIVVKRGYTPDTIVVERCRPVRLKFRRDETAACSEMVLLSAFDRRVKLPAGATVAVDILPDKPGVYEFACGAGLLRGKLIVE